jgi:hypothetical protein
VKVLLSEASSLTAREHLTVLANSGVQVEALSCIDQPLVRFSRWCRAVHPAPAASLDPLGYLRVVAELMGTGDYDALLPTHEQAWLFAVGRHLLPEHTPLALAPAEAFDQVQGKLAFCRLLDQLHIPQPVWKQVTDLRDLSEVGFPCWLKSDFSTAGRGVRHVPDAGAAAPMFTALSAAGAPVIAQRPAPGRYAQAGALFEHGRLIAVHTSEKIGEGAGGSAAARLGVDHPLVREHIARIGAHLSWHGGLTLDYLHQDGQPQYIECNPRTVEPGNAAVSGVDLPMLTIALSTGGPLPTQPLIGTPGLRTHSALALMLGTAERTDHRGAALATLTLALTGKGPYRNSREVLTPLRRDPPSGLPLLITTTRILRHPSAVATLATAAVAAYAVTPDSIVLARSTSATR